MFTVFVTLIEFNRVLKSTSHEYDTLDEAVVFVCKIPNEFYVAIVDSDLNILLPEMAAAEVNRDNIYSLMYAATL